MTSISTNPHGRQLVDWGAAIWAGVWAGAVFLAANLVLVPLFVGGNAWIVLRLFGSILLGSEVLAPPATFHFAAVLSALITHFAISIALSLLIAFIIHRGGLVTGILGGAVLGLAIYFINFYTLTYFFPWFFAMRSDVFVGTHVLFGALAGGIYEVLEVEVFVGQEPA